MSIGRSHVILTLRAYHLLAWAEHQLLVELEEVEAVLRLTGLGVDSLQELAHDLDRFGQSNLVRVLCWRVFQDGLEQEGVPSQTSSRLGQVAVQL